MKAYEPAIKVKVNLSAKNMMRIAAELICVSGGYCIDV
jgi:hypothetical protein